MSVNEIERALGDDPQIEPSSDFCARVMVEVHRQVGEHEALAFPWSRLIPGLVACALVVVVGVILDPAPPASASLVSILEDPMVAQVLTLMTSSLVGIWMLVWMSLRFAGVGR
jgi:hypothetical protein